MMSLKIILLLPLVITTQASSEVEDVKKLALANNEFAFKLHRVFKQQENAFTSPAGIFTTLAMLYEGARGITAREIHQVLSFRTAGINSQDVSQRFAKLLSLLDNSSGDYELAVANAMLADLQLPLLENYKDTLRRYYRATLRKVDFENESSKVVEEVNKWVKDKTQGKIQKLLDSISRDTALILLNGVYFKGTWKKQFSPERTAEGTFYNEGVSGVPIQMMRTTDKLLYGDFDQYGVKALKLLYKGEHISMLLLLPFERKGLRTVEQNLTATKLYDINSKLKIEKVEVSIPKFKLEDEKALKEHLLSLGMRSAFGEGANLRGIATEDNLKVSKVVHKAVIEVNEEGSEATAASSVEVAYFSLNPDDKYFRADHPFLFFVRDDRTGLILFYGRVNKL